MIPEFPEFKQLELSDRAEVENITKQFPPYSDFHFPDMWCWDIHEPVLLSKLKENLVVKQTDALSGKPYYSVIGTNAIPATIDCVCSFLTKNGLPQTLKWIPEETIQYVNGFASSVIEDRDNYDYIFDVEKIYCAKGNEFRYYRHSLNKFEKSFPYIKTLPIDLTDSIVKNQINKHFITWSKNIKTENKVGNLLFEHKALNKLLSSANEFESISSLGLFDKDELVAFSIFDIKNKDFALSPFSKANRVFEGSSQFLMKKTIEFLHEKNIKFFNIEPDFGIDSWRNYKMSYRPPFFLKKYTIERSN